MMLKTLIVVADIMCEGALDWPFTGLDRPLSPGYVGVESDPESTK